MAGFFGLFDYNKPGPGVPKDAPPKSPFIVFFEILQRKFWNLVKINLMYVLFNLPAVLAGMFIMFFFFPNIFPNAMEDPDYFLMDTIMKFILLTVMTCIPMIAVGPAQAGFTYILRNYAREEHAFIWSDFKDAAKSNLKQSLIVGTINFFITFLTLISIGFYWVHIGSGEIPDVAGAIGLVVMVMIFTLFVCMNIYIYPVMVTFDLTLKQIYKNALIFALIKFLPNLGIVLLNALLIFLSFGLIIPFNPMIGFIPYIFLTTSLTGFITNFYAYPKLKKYIISKIEEEEEEEDDEDDDNNDEEEDEETDIEKKSEVEDPDEDTATDSTGSDDIKDDDGGTVGDDGIKRYF